MGRVFQSTRVSSINSQPLLQQTFRGRYLHSHLVQLLSSAKEETEDGEEEITGPITPSNKDSSCCPSYLLAGCSVVHGIRG